jgi:hypothetical protein
MAARFAQDGMMQRELRQNPRCSNNWCCSFYWRSRSHSRVCLACSEL